jgi:hypothetical protein
MAEIIAAIALVVSILAYAQSSKRLDVKFDNELYINYEINYRDDPQSGPAFHENLAFASMTVVNPGPSDIAFFDVEVLDGDNQNLFLLAPTPDHKALYGKEKYVYYAHPIRVDINTPDDVHGIFKANSYQKTSIIFSLGDKPPKQVSIKFKTAQSFLLGRYKTYSHVYNVGIIDN